MAFNVKEQQKSEDIKLFVDESQQSFILFKGKYQSFLEELNPTILVNETEIEKYYNKGVQVYTEHYEKNNLGKPPESDLLFGGFTQFVHQLDGNFCYKTFGFDWSVIRNDDSINNTEQFEENDRLVILDKGKAIIEFEVKGLLKEKPNSKPNESDIIEDETIQDENPKVASKPKFKKIVTLFSIFLFLCLLSFSIFKWGNFSRTKILAKDENMAQEDGSMLSSRRHTQNESTDSLKEQTKPIANHNTLSTAVKLNDIDEALTLIDVRITQGNYPEARKLINQWLNPLNDNTSGLDTSNPEVEKRLKQLKHFKSLIDTSTPNEDTF
ncbi:hypothetical protein [Emticicia sp. W12TSBA100-4]|uniref:hypothetical protein n=1 Tax=Emticicia sp. W12TSBA100-4 TaxID=3160965 RepID=UPI0033062396